MEQVMMNSLSISMLIHQFLNILIISMVVYVSVRWMHKRRRSTAGQPEEAKKNLGELIRERRISSKLTQEFVAEQLGVSRQAVSKWENDAVLPSTANLLALAKLLHIPVEMLLNSTSEK